jgi:hypothetical protein
MIALVKDGADQKKIVKDVPKGAFLSTFLVYVMLKSKNGIKAETKYDYKAIAEEDADIYSGVAYVKNQEEVGGVPAYKVLNDFKGAKFFSMITEKGEVLSTKSPVQGIGTELVASPSLATNNISIPSSLLTSLFGEVPTGTKNEVFRKLKSTTTTAPLPAAEQETSAKPTIPEGATKQHGVPKNMGIMMKPGSDSQKSPPTTGSDPSN